MKLLSLLPLIFLFPLTSFSQVLGKDFEPGIYLSVDDFRENSPLRTDQVVNKDDDLFALLKAGEEVKIHHRDSTFKITTQNIWGYADGKSVFITKAFMQPKFAWRGFEVTSRNFTKIDVLGKISLIYYMKTTESEILGANRSRNNNKPRLMEFILNVENGEVKKLTKDHLREVMSHDEEFLFRLNNLYDSDFKKKKGVVYALISDYNKKYSVFQKDKNLN
ncbi:MAG: hypothetical protein AAFQ94_04395 [Bacteroidota bacterium]